MTRGLTYSLTELATAIGATVQGDGDCKIHNVAAIAQAQPGEISFVTDRKYRKYLTQTKASAILLDEKLASRCPINALVMSNPKLGFAKLLTLLRPQSLPTGGIHPTAVVGANCQIDPSAHIGAHVVIEEDVVIGPRTLIGAGASIGRGSQIGSDCCLHSRVTLYSQTRIGDRSIIHSGAVIGADGFGLIQDEKGEWVKIPQVG
ncbi:UDP-3-O-(3-hydroxymyristoyl)glucosamine N-acyltransferase, partial [Coxiella burnetii]